MLQFSRTGTARYSFTLIELMIVIAIIGVLASIAIPNVRKARDKAYQEKCWENSGLLTRTTEQLRTENAQISKPNSPVDPPILALVTGGKAPKCPRVGPSGEYQWASGADDDSQVKCTLHGFRPVTLE